MSKFLKFIVHFVVICTILCVVALAVPPFFGVTTEIRDDSTVKSNLAMGSVTYAIPVKTEEAALGTPILVNDENAVYRYTLASADVANGTGTAMDPTVSQGQPINVAIGSYLPKIVVTIPFIGYLMAATKSIEGLIICGLSKQDTALHKLIRTGKFKIVLIDAPGVAENTSCIHIDHARAQYEVAKETILENNCHRILYIAGKKNGYVSEERLQGMKRLAEELKISFIPSPIDTATKPVSLCSAVAAGASCSCVSSFSITGCCISLSIISETFSSLSRRIFSIMIVVREPYKSAFCIASPGSFV